ncbi:hypothetical protein PEPS_38950 (plasmid) [Persicobacter psychrovividus]|uniref:Uncharacterized protein n=2 Tax=Persicobacter psychrovividus TaxID=387638 RepID=A0ABN6LEL9_9BACT|nr:hypothetical protein PEPS_38950 [Persicobacter psychrovividus]
MRPTSTYFTKATMLVAVLVMLLSACKKGDEISPAQQQFNTEMETLQAIFKSYGVSAEKVDARMTTKETNIQSVDFSALDLTAIDERLYTIRIQKTIDLRDNQLDMEVINTVKTKFPKVEVLVSGNPPYEQDIELETLEKLGVSADSERVVKNTEGFVSELDLSGMDKVDLDTAIFHFQQLEKLNLANNDLQFHHWKALVDGIDGLAINMEGNRYFEVSEQEMERMQAYLDHSGVKAQAKDVITVYTTNNHYADEDLANGSSIGYINTVDLSAYNIADLSVPSDDFQLLIAEVESIDLSNSTFDLDSYMDPKRVGALAIQLRNVVDMGVGIDQNESPKRDIFSNLVSKVVVKGNQKFENEAKSYIEKQNFLFDIFDNLWWAVDGGSWEFTQTTYGSVFTSITLPLLNIKDNFNQTAYHEGFFSLKYLKNINSETYVTSFEGANDLNVWEFVNKYPIGSKESFSLFLQSNLYFPNEFSDLNTSCQFGLMPGVVDDRLNSINYFKGIVGRNVIIEENALSSISTPIFHLYSSFTEISSNTLNVGFQGKSLSIRAGRIISQSLIDKLTVNFLYGHSPTDEEIGTTHLRFTHSVREEDPNIEIELNIDLNNFPDLEFLYLSTTGTINLDETKLASIPKVYIKSKNINVDRL